MDVFYCKSAMFMYHMHCLHFLLFSYFNFYFKDFLNLYLGFFCPQSAVESISHNPTQLYVTDKIWSRLHFLVSADI